MIRKDWEIFLLQFITLSVAFGAAVIISSFAINELTVSDHFGNESVVRVLQRNETSAFEGRNRLTDRIPEDVFRKLKDNEVAKVARTKTLNDLTLGNSAKSVSALRVHAVDTNITSILKFNVGGNARLSDNSILISESIAENLFGMNEAVGQILKLSTLNDTLDLRVAGTFSDPPKNSHDQFNALIDYNPANIERLGFDKNSFGVYAGPHNNQSSRPRSGTSVLNSLSTPTHTYRFQPVREIYFGPRVIGESARHGDFYTVLILTCITGLIVLLAVTNFVNLISLTLPARSTELAMRKVAGAHRIPLLSLMAKENIAVSSISFAIGVILIAAAIPYVQSKLSIDLAEWLLNAGWKTYAVLIVLFVVIASAPLIPAWAFVKATPGRLLGTDRITFPRMKKVITVVQLGVSISLIIASLVIDRQISRSLIKEPGMNHDQVIYMPFPSGMSKEYYQNLKNSWPRDNPNIVGLIAVSHTPDNLTSRPIGKDYYTLQVDRDFLNFFDLKMESGRWFGVNDSDSVITGGGVSSSSTGNSMGHIGNLTDAFNLPSKSVEIRPIDNTYNYLMIKVIEVDIRKTIAYIARSFEETYGKHVNISFLDRNYADRISYEDRLNKLSGILSTISIIMACCAIYALSLSRMKDNLKQIAIRKTFGASDIHIVGRLSLQFFELMLASLFLFGPLTYLFLQEWLGNFAYSAKFGWADPLISIGACVIIVGITNLFLLGRINVASIRELLRR